MENKFYESLLKEIQNYKLKNDSIDPMFFLEKIMLEVEKLTEEEAKSNLVANLFLMMNKDFIIPINKFNELMEKAKK